MSKIKSHFKQFLSEIYTVRLCKKMIDSEVESKSHAEIRNGKWEFKWEMKNEKWGNILHLVMYYIKVDYFYMSLCPYANVSIPFFKK